MGPFQAWVGWMLLLLACRDTARVAAAGVQLWEPSLQNPVHVHHVSNYTRVLDGGLNKMLYAHAQVLDKGCTLAERNQQTDPPSFGVVLLPPFNSDIAQMIKAYRIKNRRQAFSDVFGLQKLAHDFREKRNCFVSDAKQFEQLVDSGAVVLSEKVEHAGGKALSLGSHPYIGSTHSQLYALLELSSRLRDRYFTPCLERIDQRFGGEKYLAVHLRVEDDWMAKFCWDWTPEMLSNARDKWHEGLLGKRDIANCFPPTSVANITLSTNDLQGYTRILLLYAENNFLRSTTARDPAFAVDPKSVWPASVSAVSLGDISCFDEDASYTDRTAVSLMMAGHADAFAGFIQSRMSTGAVKLRTGHGKMQNSYFYDCRSVGYHYAVKVKSIRRLITHC